MWFNDKVWLFLSNLWIENNIGPSNQATHQALQLFKLLEDNIEVIPVGNNSTDSLSVLETHELVGMATRIPTPWAPLEHFTAREDMLQLQLINVPDQVLLTITQSDLQGWKPTIITAPEFSKFAPIILLELQELL